MNIKNINSAEQLALPGAQQLAKKIALALHYREELDPAMLVFIRKIVQQNNVGHPSAVAVMKYFTDYVYNSGKFCPEAVNKISIQLNLIIKNSY